MNKIELFSKLTISFVLITALGFPLRATNEQTARPKKWTYDFSEAVKFFETPLEACKSYVKEKHPNENYKAVIEKTNAAEMYRCSADDAYIGVVYQRECTSCDNKPAPHNEQFFKD